ncbi:DnaJ domain-containing protein [Floccifex sp.]|uniref:DnaJ domain-containing protein n=1 Tax=Floccifex sp. TaxID=2815810 RepID=UPI003F07E120
MVQDPYRVLGIDRNATEEEIKRAYRKKAKECHPDLHPDDPDAQQKMNEVNEAYDMLKNPEKYRQTASSSYTSNQGYQQAYYGDFSDFFNSFQQSQTIEMPQVEPNDSLEIQDIIHCIQQHEYKQAYNRLSSIGIHARSARWYYLFAVTCIGLGYTQNAKESIEKCVRLEPNRQDYQRVYSALHTQQSFYSYGNPFTYQRTYTYRRRHSILWYFIVIQFVMWLLQAIFFGFGARNMPNNQPNYYYDYGENNEQV